MVVTLGLVLELAIAFAQVPAIEESGAQGLPAARKPPEQLLLERIADARGFRAEFDAVPAHLAQMVRDRDASLGKARLSRVIRGLSEPFSVPDIATELRDGLATAVAAPDGVQLLALIEQTAAWLDLESRPLSNVEGKLAEIDALWGEIQSTDITTQPVNEELLANLSEYVALCHDELSSFTETMSDDERLRLRSAFPDWCEALFREHFPKGEITQAQALLIDQFKLLVRKVDRARLLAVAARVVRLADPAFLASLGKRLAKCARTHAKVDGFSGDVIATAGVSSESRTVLLGGGKTTIRGRAALVIDLGGDDVWERAAVVDDATALVSVVIELNGNDRYSSAPATAPRALSPTTSATPPSPAAPMAQPPGPAYAAGGIALLIDARGKDQYTSGRLGQGAAALGVAALVDLEGDDHYTAQDFVQGYAFAGVGYLLDRAGNDTYDAWAYAQGAGNGNGCSALVDGGGNDRYIANGHWPDVYGDSGPGSFHGASQGYSFGFRDGNVLLPGGLAVLADLGDGKDYYESGNFSQGGAYFFGFGLMFDGGGDDENHGYRYSQGFGVHQAVGMRWDAGGNDRYSTKCAANCGSAWDEGVGWLLDESGDDQYDVGGLALGGTANTAVAVLLDGGGDDRYGGGGGTDTQGGSSDSSYHKMQAIGALIDLGGGKDTYTRKERGDGLLLTGDWFGLFVDAKEKSAAALLTSKELEKLLAAVPPAPPTKQ